MEETMNTLTLADRLAYARMIRKAQEREYRKVRKEIKQTRKLAYSL